MAVAALSAVASTKADSPAASNLEIVRVYTGWRDGASFKRIAEYFDGKEHSGRITVLRSHPEQRTGFYFLVRLKNPGAPHQVNLNLHYIEQGTPASRVVTFPAELGAGSTVFQLGLTGPEWHEAKAQPVAWHVEILAADGGQMLVSEKSYLWEKPAAK